MPSYEIEQKVVDGKKVIKKTVYIDQITSGKLENGIFSFCYKKRQINTSPFSLKEPSASYGFGHHLDQYDLMRLSKKYPNLIPYHPRYNLELWGDRIRYEFFNLIRTGALDQVIENEDHIFVLNVKWTGPILYASEL